MYVCRDTSSNCLQRMRIRVDDRFHLEMIVKLNVIILDEASL